MPAHNPKCSRIRRMIAASVMKLIIFISPPHLGQVSGSISQTFLMHSRQERGRNFAGLVVGYVQHFHSGRGRWLGGGVGIGLALYMKVAMAPIMQRRSARLSFFVVAGPYGPAMLVSHLITPVCGRR